MDNKEIEILLIEDSIHDAELTIRALRRNDVAKHILHLRDGAIALDYLYATGQYTGRDLANKPKLILLDLKMPKVSGLEVLERIAGDKTTYKIPVVVLTSSKEHPDVDQAYLLGANSYIVKPVDFESFSQVVNAMGMYWLLHNHPPHHT